MNRIEIQSLLTYFQTIKIDQEDKYLVTYPYYIEYFAGLNEISKSDLIRGVGLVYSWMPRILSINLYSTNDLIQSIKKMKNQTKDSSEKMTFNLAVQFTNGSTIAASKLLHFIFPSIYPIYDSHIYRYCWGKKKIHHYQINQERKYHSYKDQITELSTTLDAKKLKKFVSAAIGYSVNEIRALEFSIFHISKTKHLHYKIKKPVRQ